MPDGEDGYGRVIRDFEQDDIAGTTEADDQFAQERRFAGRLATGQREFCQEP